MAQAHLQGAQINFGTYLGYNRQVQPPLPQHRPPATATPTTTTTNTKSTKS